MIINGQALLETAPIKNMESSKIHYQGVTYGMGEAGYDIRIKQDVCFTHDPNYPGFMTSMVDAEEDEKMHVRYCNRFVLASAIEEFDMPDWLVAVVHDKSTWARRGLSVFNTVIEPGWKGFLTLELVYHGSEKLIIPAGSGIAQVMFHQIKEPRSYKGRYQNQEDKPVGAIST